ncbi:hypothetical protein Gpo141_00010959 [Globisporangium polare]
MVQITRLLSAAVLVALALLELAAAHPGEQPHVESAEQHVQRRLFVESSKHALKACANAPHTRRLQEQLQEARAAKVQQLRSEVAARRRLATSTVLATTHLSTLTGVTTKTSAATLFGSTPKCVLEPDVTQGPYYVNGELIRNDIRETQTGVTTYIELQLIDVNTCTPVENVYVDFWHCNSTGVYSGVVASGNGNSADKTNAQATFNRGLAPTDANGLVNFTTTFPGHYTSRATHIHVMGSQGGTVLANKTYVSSKAASVGQIFFDQDLITKVEATSAYSVNKQPVTKNADDTIFASSSATNFDPVVNYVLLGSTVEDGIFGWISIGIDKSASKQVTAAATFSGNSSSVSATTTTTTATTNTTTTAPTPAPTSSSMPFTGSVFVALVVVVTALLFQ